MRGLLTAPCSQGASALEKASAGGPTPPSLCRLHVCAAAGGQRPHHDRTAPPSRPPSTLPPTEGRHSLRQANNIVPTPRSRLACNNKVLQHQQGAGTEASTAQRANATEVEGVAADVAGTTRSKTRQQGSQLDGAHKPFGMVVGSAWLLSVSVQLTGRRQEAGLETRCSIV